MELDGSAQASRNPALPTPWEALETLLITSEETQRFRSYFRTFQITIESELALEY